MQKDVRVIQSIQRAIDIINCFDYQYHTLTLPQISEKLNLNINTTRGIMNTLVLNGYIDHDLKTNTYSLGLVYIPKADLVSSKSIDKIKSLAHPLLENLANNYQVSARLQVISNHNIFTVDTINPENTHYIVISRLNVLFELNATSSGKIFLKYMEPEKIELYLNNINPIKYTENTIVDKDLLKSELLKIDENGYSTEFDEIGLGISSIAVPILKSDNTLYGTISTTASSTVISSVLDDIVLPMKECARFISDKLSTIQFA